MDIRSVITREMTEIAVRQNKVLAPLEDGLPLLESGMDSLSIGVLLASLEEKLGVDPFDDDSVDFPETLGDLVGLYERAAKR
jgi:acyl carrier protein